MRMSIYRNSDEDLKSQYLSPLICVICEICGLTFPGELRRRLRSKDVENDSVAGQKE
jgi:hypothetical protein